MFDFTPLASTLKQGSVPIYRAVAEYLRSEITSGRLPEGTQLPSEAALAAQLHINHQTLRKSLRILAELKLITQCQGRGTFVSYKTDEHLKIGVFVDNLAAVSNDQYAQNLIVSLTRAIHDHYHCALTLLELNPPTPAAILNQINQNACDALIILDPYPSTVELFCHSTFDDIPMVFVNASLDHLEGTLKYLVTCEAGSIAQAVHILHDLGHRDIAFIQAAIPTREQDAPFLEREREFIDTCKTLNLSTDFVCEANGLWYDTVRDLTQKLFNAPHRPTACILPGYIYSCAAWQGLLEAGLQIPRDVSFIGFDANPYAHPHMSFMAHPYFTMAQKAIELIYDIRNKGKHLKQHVYAFDAEFVDQGSCQPLPPRKNRKQTPKP